MQRPITKREKSSSHSLTHTHTAHTALTGWYSQWWKDNPEKLCLCGETKFAKRPWQNIVQKTWEKTQINCTPQQSVTWFLCWTGKYNSWFQGIFFKHGRCFESDSSELRSARSEHRTYTCICIQLVKKHPFLRVLKGAAKCTQEEDKLLYKFITLHRRV